MLVHYRFFRVTIAFINIYQEHVSSSCFEFIGQSFLFGFFSWLVFFSCFLLLFYTEEIIYLISQTLSHQLFFLLGNKIFRKQIGKIFFEILPLLIQFHQHCFILLDDNFRHFGGFGNNKVEILFEKEGKRLFVQFWVRNKFIGNSRSSMDKAVDVIQEAH